MRGDGRIFQRGEIYWVAYYLRGKEHREAAKTKDGKNTGDPIAAMKFLRARLKEVHADEVGGRTFTTPQACRLTVHDLVEALKADYELRGKLSAQNTSYLKRVQANFGDPVHQKWRAAQDGHRGRVGRHHEEAQGRARGQDRIGHRDLFAGVPSRRETGAGISEELGHGLQTGEVSA